MELIIENVFFQTSDHLCARVSFFWPCYQQQTFLGWPFLTLSTHLWLLVAVAIAQLLLDVVTIF